jgi:hypothetical protein
VADRQISKRLVPIGRKKFNLDLPYTSSRQGLVYLFFVSSIIFSNFLAAGLVG